MPNSSLPSMAPLPPQGPLGNPTNLEARKIPDAVAKFCLKWVPAPNATEHRIYIRIPENDNLHCIGKVESGYDSVDTPPLLGFGLTDGSRFFFGVVAVQSQPDSSEVCSDWSNWVPETISYG